eukprot:83534_1
MTRLTRKKSKKTKHRHNGCSNKIVMKGCNFKATRKGKMIVKPTLISHDHPDVSSRSKPRRTKRNHNNHGQAEPEPLPQPNSFIPSQPTLATHLIQTTEELNHSFWRKQTGTVPPKGPKTSNNNENPVQKRVLESSVMDE